MPRIARASARRRCAAAPLVDRADDPGLSRDVAPRPPIDPRVRALLDLVDEAFPSAARSLLREGVRRLIDYQDLAYAQLYLDRIARVAAGPQDGAGVLLAETARHLALWMSYEDTIRVAALKTRATRFARVRAEVRAGADQVLAIDEYLHPRVQEIAETLPASLGRRLERDGWLRRVVERSTRRGPRRHDELAVGIPDAVRGRGDEALAARDDPLRRRGHGDRGVAGANRGGGGDRTRARRRGRPLPAPRQGLQRHARARRPQLRDGDGGVVQKGGRRSRRRRFASCATPPWPTSTASPGGGAGTPRPRLTGAGSDDEPARRPPTTTTPTRSAPSSSPTACIATCTSTPSCSSSSRSTSSRTPGTMSATTASCRMPGDYITVEIAGRPLIAVRHADARCAC